MDEAAQKINTDPKTLQAFTDKKPLDLMNNEYFTQNFYYDIQGNPINSKRATLRDTIAYQRFLGHLLFYSTLSREGDKPVISIISKLIDPNEYKYIGINQLISPLNKFKDELEIPDNSKILLMDPGKIIVDLTNMKCYELDEVDQELRNIIIATSALEETKGKVTLKEPELEGNYNYETGEGVCIFVQKN